MNDLHRNDRHRRGCIPRPLWLALAMLLPGLVDLSADCSLSRMGLTPLTDRGDALYLGEWQGGLYPDGHNREPNALRRRAIRRARRVEPLDRFGNPSADGKVVFLAVGMSNTRTQFNRFERRVNQQTGGLDPNLVIVNASQGGRDARSWGPSDSPTWATARQLLRDAGVTPQQVQVVWIKQARARPVRLGSFPTHAEVLTDDLADIARSIQFHYPNVQLTFVSGRTRAYTDQAQGLNPEPFAFESSFATKWVVERQLAGDPDLNWDPALGAVRAPVLLWGPYLWADGTAGRSDGFVWSCDDLARDFTHPSGSGQEKVADQLEAFFRTRKAATRWFLRGTAIGSKPTVTISVSSRVGSGPLTVEFAAEVADQDGRVTGTYWTFGDGTFSLERSPTKTFHGRGVHRVRFAALDDDGNTTLRTIRIRVQ